MASSGPGGVVDGARGRAGIVAAALCLGLLVGCGDGAPQVRLPAAPAPTPTTSGPPLTATATATSPVTATSTSTATATPTSSATPTTTAAPTTTATAGPAGATADLDGDGELDRAAVAGATLTARLSTTGAVESVGLPQDAVPGDVQVLGRSDLDGDGVDEALVRTLRSATGDVRVVLRLSAGGLEVLTSERGGPFELVTAGGLSGPRSYECRETDAASTGREVRTLDSERDPAGEALPTFSGTVTTWSVSGEQATVVGTENFTEVAADSRDLQLPIATCEQ